MSTYDVVMDVLRSRLRTPAKAPSRIKLEDHGMETPCFVWQAARHPSGYGHLSDGGRVRGAHLAIYEAIHGPVGYPALELDHLCRNRACVNPDHLEPVTKSENQLRRLPQTHCVRGHLFDELNTRVRDNGKRICRICDRIRVAEFRARKRDMTEFDWPEVVA